MKFKTSLKFASITLGMISTLSAFAEDQHHNEETVKIQVTDIQTGFSLLQGKGGNMLLSQGDDGLLLIDSDYKAVSPQLEKTLEQWKQPVVYILNTHWHGDHTGGNEHLGTSEKHAGLPIIIAHDNVRKRLLTRQTIPLFNMESQPYPKPALPEITFNQNMALYFNDQSIELKHLPNGHTDGDLIVHFKEAHILHMGDHFFNGIFPFIDINSGGSVAGTIQNIEMVLKSIPDDTLIIPGHGPQGTKADLIAFKEMLIGTQQEVQSLMDNGLSLEKIQAHGLAPKWKPWHKGFLNEATWISIIYESIAQEKSSS